MVDHADVSYWSRGDISLVLSSDSLSGRTRAIEPCGGIDDTSRHQYAGLCIGIAASIAPLNNEEDPKALRSDSLISTYLALRSMTREE